MSSTIQIRVDDELNSKSDQLFKRFWHRYNHSNPDFFDTSCCE